MTRLNHFWLAPGCLLLLLTLLPARGESVAPVAAPEPAPEPAATAAAIPSETDRDPFWPVGYQRPEPAAEGVIEPVVGEPAPAAEKPKATLQIDNLNPEQQAAIRRQLKVSGIMRFGPDYVARINNQLVDAGDELPVELEGQRLVFVVRSITKEAVQLEPKR